MLEIFEYREVDYDPNKSIVEQLNEQGQHGWEFATQAQKIENTIDFKTGQNKISIVTIYKRKVIKTNGTA